MQQERQQYYTGDIETDRLLLRPVAPEDESPWIEFFKDPEAIRFLGFQKHARPEELAAHWIKRQHDRYKKDQFGLKAITSKNNGELLGMCGLLVQDINGQEEIEIGYHVLKKYWGQGFASEAAIALKDYAFRNSFAVTLISIIHPDNVRSQKVATKNGMSKQEKVLWHNQEVLIYRTRNI